MAWPHAGHISSQFEELAAAAAEEEGEAAAQVWTSSQADPGCRQQPEPERGMPPQAPMHKADFLQAQRYHSHVKIPPSEPDSRVLAIALSIAIHAT